MAKKVQGLLLIPYQWLQILGYRLSGVTCQYNLGTFGVEPQQQVTYIQRLIGKFFPILILLLGIMLQVVISIYLAQLYLNTLPWLPLLFILLSTPPLALLLHYGYFDLKQKDPIFNSNRSSLSDRKY